MPMTPQLSSRAHTGSHTFIQLAIRRFLPRLPSGGSSPRLDFLTPPRRLLRTSAASPHRRPCPSTVIQQSAAPARQFTVSRPRCATQCVQNPRTEPDGSPILLEITPRCAKRLGEIMERETNPDLALRIQVESGGCHGFQYFMSLTTMPSPSVSEKARDVPHYSDDVVFQYRPDQQTVPTELPGGPVSRIVVDPISLNLLKGSKVDFTEELIGSHFAIVDNPYASTSCGCGSSFDIKL